MTSVRTPAWDEELTTVNDLLPGDTCRNAFHGSTSDLKVISRKLLVQYDPPMLDFICDIYHGMIPPTHPIMRVIDTTDPTEGPRNVPDDEDRIRDAEPDEELIEIQQLRAGDTTRNAFFSVTNLQVHGVEWDANGNVRAETSHSGNIPKWSSFVAPDFPVYRVIPKPVRALEDLFTAAMEGRDGR